MAYKKNSIHATSKKILLPSLPKIKLFLVYCLYQYKFKVSYGDKSGVSDLGHYSQ